MRILEMDMTTLTLEFSIWELNPLIELARIAETNAAGAYCTEFDDELPPYYQEREDLLLTAGLWRSLLEMSLMASNMSLTFTEAMYQNMRYLGSRNIRQGEKAHAAARYEYPDAHSLDVHRKKEREAKAAAVEDAVPEVTEERIPRPTDQQSGRLEES